MRITLPLALLLLATPALAAKPAPVPASDLLITQQNANISWRWRAAPEVATEPALLAALRQQALADAAKAKAAAARDAADARKAGFPFRRYEAITDWSRAADTPHLLALAGLSYSFTGGAHGNTGYAVKIWDKQANKAIPFAALFSDWPRARRLLEPAYCAALAEEQRRRRGAAPAGDFDTCPKLSEQPILPWADLATTAGQFRVLLGPYVAGPYAEGSYLVTTAWPEGVRSLVKPAYRDDLFGSR